MIERIKRLFTPQQIDEAATQLERIAERHTRHLDGIYQGPNTSPIVHIKPKIRLTGVDIKKE